MNRKLKVFVAALILISTINMKTQADPLSEGGQNYKLQIQNDEGSIQSLEDKKLEIEKKIELLDSQIVELIQKINEDSKNIEQIELEIKVSKEQLEKLEKDIEDENVLFSRRVRTMYMTGKDSYLEALLSAKGISDFASKVEAIKDIMDYDKKMLANLNNKKLEIKKKESSLNEKNEKLLKLKVDNEAKLKSLNESKDTQNLLLEQLKNQQQAAVESKKNNQIDVDEILKQIQGNQFGIESADSFEKNLLAFAVKYIGTPYHWAGTNPTTGFDCSGFTQFVYGEFGIKLGRSTYDQINDGKHVSKSELKPGDLVLFGSGGSPRHVGIYVGDNCYIHSPRTGDVVKISAMDRGDFLVGVRVR